MSGADSEVAQLAAVARRVLAPLIAGNERRKRESERRLQEIRAAVTAWRGPNRPTAACIRKRLAPPRPSERTVARYLARIASSSAGKPST
jgi:hypothetical protein